MYIHISNLEQKEGNASLSLIRFERNMKKYIMNFIYVYKLFGASYLYQIDGT